MRQRLKVGSVIVGLALGLSACGGGGSSPTSSSPSGPTRQNLGTRSWQAAVGDGSVIDLTIGTAGTLDATVQWTFSSNDVDVYLTSSSCSTAAFFADTCTYLAKADSFTNKPERMTSSVIPGNYKVWVYNAGPNSESGTVEVGLTY